MSAIKGLICRKCHRTFEAKALYYCEYCFGPLDVDYDYAKIKKVIARKRVRKGPSSIWRFKDLLPVDGERYVEIHAGYTPLQRADRLGAMLGIKNLFIKNDTLNPTYSTKDRMVSVAVSRGIELGYKTLACASTGNLAQSLAAHAAKAGLKSYIFVPNDTEPLKLTATGIYNPNVLFVDGTTEEINKLCLEFMSRTSWGFVNVNLRPYYYEGAKTLAFEVVEQLDWTPPDHVILPMASGGTLIKVKRGFEELEYLDLIRHDRTVIHGVQAEGCSPITTAYRTNSRLIRPVKPDTIAKSLAVSNPADGIYALEIIRKTGGAAEGASDDEIIDGIKLLAQTEGIFAEPAGGAAVAAAVKLAKTKIFKPTDNVVLYITGGGLKTPEYVSDLVMKPNTIKPDPAILEQVIASINRSES